MLIIFDLLFDIRDKNGKFHILPTTFDAGMGAAGKAISDAAEIYDKTKAVGIKKSE